MSKKPTYDILVQQVKDLELEAKKYREAEKKLRFLSTLVEQSAESIIHTDTQFKIDYMNKSAEELLGYSLEEVKGKKIDFFNSESISKKIQKNIKNEISNGLPYKVESRIKRKDGSQFYCFNKISPILNENHTINGYVVSQRDITDQKLAEDALLKERNLFVAGPIVVFHWLPKEGWPVVYVSPNIKEVFGYETQDFTTGCFPYPDIIHPDDLKRIAKEIDQFLGEGRSHFKQNYRFRHKNGGYHWIDDYTTVVRNGSNEVTALYGYILDISDRILADKKIRQNEERLNLAIQGTGVGLWDWNIKTDHRVVNERWAEISGYTLKELSPISIKTWRKLVHPEDLIRSDEILKQHFDRKTSFYECEVRMKHKKGHWVWVLDRGKVFEWDELGNPVRMAGTHLDITRRKKTEEALQKYSDRLKLASMAGGIGVWELDIRTNELYWDEQMYKLYQVDPSSFKGRFETWKKCVHPDDIDDAEMALKKAMEQKRHFNWEFRIIWPDGSIRTIHAAALPQFNRNGQTIRMTGVNWDITLRKRMEEEIRRLAITDPLTGAKNRRQFTLRAEEEFDRSNRYKTPLSIFILDIDHFKSINDTYGHDVGDIVLKKLVQECNSKLRNSDIFCRLGGEEFAAILPQTDIENAKRSVKRIFQSLQILKIPVPGREIQFTVSIGITTKINKDQQIETIIKRADMALYKAKKNGRNRIVVGISS